jgi:outer membrane protein assembly factor BamB
MFAFSLSGTPAWERRWDRRKTRGDWGSAASPIVYRGRVYLVNDNEEHSFIEALDCATGKTVWKTDRDERSNWSTPLIWENRQRTEIVTPGTGKVRSYDLSGNLLWELTGMSGITVPTPLSGHGMVYVSSGFNGSRLRPLYAIRGGASGDISLREGETSNRYIAWCQPKAGAYNVSPILLSDQMYALLDRGTIASWDARTGAEIYPFQRIDSNASAFTASPWAYEGKIFCLSEDGDTFVIQAGPEMRVLAKNSLGEMCLSSPALVPGALIIRTTEALYRIGDSPR